MQQIKKRIYRSDEVEKTRRALLRSSYPRLQMMLLVSITGLSGFVASVLLLHAGMTAMWSRYLAACGIAYLVFLALLWLWLRTRTDDYSNLPDGSWDTGSAHVDVFTGEGGCFGGGGASGSFDGAVSESIDGGAGGSGTSIGDALSTVGDAEELAIPIAAVVLFVAVAASSLFLVYDAPALFAELLFDGALSASLYHRLRGLEPRYWLETALRKTAWPFILTGIAVAACGLALGGYAPGAHSLAEVAAYHRPEAVR